MPGSIPAKQVYRRSLSTDAESLDNSFVSGQLFAFQIVQQAPSLTDKFKKTTTAVMIFFVYFEVFGQIRNTLGQDCDLNLG